MYLTSTNNFFNFFLMGFSCDNKKIFQIWTLFLVIGLGNVQALRAQPFSEIELVASYGALSQYEDNYNQRLSVSDGISFAVRTPYYIGYLGFNLDYFNYNRKNENFYDFTSIHASLGLFNKINFTKYLSLNIGLSSGIQNLIYDGLEDKRTSESELFYALEVEPSLNFKGFSVVLDSNVRRVYSYHRQTILFIGLGLKTSFMLSKRVQKVIR